jgi:predicted RND superfamily exporter protein
MKLSKNAMKTKKQQADRGYYLKHRNRIIKRVSVYNKENSQRRKEQYKSFKSNSPESRRKRYLRMAYKLTPQEYDELRTTQDGGCAICFRKVNRLVVDHDHTTGKIRSLLCTTCNTGLGQFGDNIALLEKAITYLKSFE